MNKIICIGDSLTSGYGTSSEYTWFNLLQKKVPNIKFKNKGINGNSSTDILFRFYEDVVLEKPSYALIMAGTNDFFFNYSSKNVYENILIMCKDCIINNIIPIIIIPIPINISMALKRWDNSIDYSKVNSKIQELKILLNSYCNYHKVLLIDLSYPYNLNKDPDSLYIDGVHPSINGHQLIYQNIFYSIHYLTS